MPQNVAAVVGTAENGYAGQARQLMGKTFGGNFDWMETGLKAGFYKSNTVTIDGVPSYFMLWHLNDQKCFFINLAAELPAGIKNFEKCWQAIETFAKAQGAKGIEFVTMRRGLIEKIKTQGLEVAGVYLTKKL